MGVNKFGDIIQRSLEVYIKAFSHECGVCKEDPGKCASCEDGTWERYVWENWDPADGTEMEHVTEACRMCEGSCQCSFCEGRGIVIPTIADQISYVLAETLTSMEVLREQEQYDDAWELHAAGLAFFMQMRAQLLEELGAEHIQEQAQRMSEGIVEEFKSPAGPKVTFSGTGALTDEELKELLGDEGES